MSRPPSYSPFSIDVGENSLFYVCVGSVRISSPFRDKAICRELCSALDRSFRRLDNRYSLKDYHLSSEGFLKGLVD